jgi:hypothetical protein
MRIDALYAIADQSIRRACGFVALAIVLVMLALMGEPTRAQQVGAGLVALLAVILYFRGLGAPRRPYSRTELWLHVKGRFALDGEQLQRLIGRTLAERYFWYARIAAWGALWLSSLAILSAYAQMPVDPAA